MKQKTDRHGLRFSGIKAVSLLVEQHRTLSASLLLSSPDICIPTMRLSTVFLSAIFGLSMLVSAVPTLTQPDDAADARHLDGDMSLILSRQSEDLALRSPPAIVAVVNRVRVEAIKAIIRVVRNHIQGAINRDIDVSVRFNLPSMRIIFNTRCASTDRPIRNAETRSLH